MANQRWEDMAKCDALEDEILNGDSLRDGKMKEDALK